MRQILIKQLFFVFLVSIGIYADLVWHLPSFVGGGLLVLFLWLNGRQASEVMVRMFGFEQNWMTQILGGFLVLSVLGSVAGIVIVFGRLTSFAIVTSLVLTGLLFSILYFYRGSSTVVAEKNQGDDEKLLVFSRIERYKILIVVAYAILIVVGFVTLYVSRSQATLATPWQTIGWQYWVIFFLATFFLGLLIYTRLSHSFILLLCIIHSLLWHSFLPLTHDLMYGADGWRHMGNEAVIMAEEPVLKAVVNSEPLSFVQKLDPGIFSYSQFWATLAIVARLGHVPLIFLYAWWLPLVSAILMPLLLNRLGAVLDFSPRHRLLVVWLGFLPFALSSAGAFTLPVNYGLLIFLLSVILILERIKNPRPGQRGVLLAMGLLMLFGYSLYFILFWLAWALASAISWRMKNQHLQHVKDVGCIVAGGLFLPFLEVVARYSHFISGALMFKGVRQLIGNFLSLYLASGPRPHDIAAGNIIFNQVPSYAFVGNWLIVSRWWLVAVVVGFWITVAAGLWQIFKQQSLVLKVWAALSECLLLGYVVGRYLLAGEQVLTRRLDAILAVCLVVLFALGWIEITRQKSDFNYKKLRQIILILVVSAAITASYTLGPDTNTASVDEYTAMQAVWAQDQNESWHCVIADTYPLLALEAISARQVIGGGFPINQYFGQAELTTVLKQIQTEPEKGWPQSVWQATGADHCFVVVSNPAQHVQEFFKQSEADVVFSRGINPAFPSLVVWRYTKPQ